MTRSTPIAQLKQEKPPDSNESELVNEILQELESGNQKQVEEPQGPSTEEILLEHQQHYEQQMALQQQEYEKVLQEHINNHNTIKNNQESEKQKLVEDYEKRIEALQKPQVPTLDEIKEKMDKEKSMKDKIIDLLKVPLIVTAIVFLLSLSITTNLLESILPDKEFITNNSSLVISFIKSILGGSVTMGALYVL